MFGSRPRERYLTRKLFLALRSAAELRGTRRARVNSRVSISRTDELVNELRGTGIRSGGLDLGTQESVRDTGHRPEHRYLLVRIQANSLLHTPDMRSKRYSPCEQHTAINRFLAT